MKKFQGSSVPKPSMKKISQTLKYLKEEVFKIKTENIQPLCISRDYVQRVSDFRFLGIQIEEDLSWNANSISLYNVQ